MQNVMYHFTDQIAVHIRYLEGDLLPSTQGTIPVFDDSRSFKLNLSAAEISLRTDDLANALNQYVFAAPDAPIKKIEITTNGSALKIKGQLHSRGDIPFEAEGTLSATPDGEIRIHAEKVKAAYLPVKGLLDLLGVKISDLINTKKVAGLRADGNDLLLNPGQVFPPPLIQGKVSAVRIEGSRIVQIFGKAPATSEPRAGGNYMAYRGAQLKFGKLTMEDTDLVLVDMDPKDPFDFFLAHYKEQLAAGYTKTTLDSGLRVFMPDFNKLHQPIPHRNSRSRLHTR
jgi:hypothetical protein